MKLNRNLLVILAAVVLVVMAGGALLVNSPSAPAATNADGGLISPQGYQEQFISQPTTHFLLDVRTPEEFASGHLDGAANISVQTLAQRLADVPRDQPIVVYCRSGNRSAQAAQILAQAGYTNVYDLGGIITWEAAGYPVVR